MKIICIGRNYIDHAKELNNPVPESPLIFMKPSTALLTDGKPFYYPQFSSDIQYELELVIKIKKNGKSIAEKFAGNYYDEIGLGIDFTARDIQNKLKSSGHPWELAKAFDYSACIGGFVQKDHLNMQSIRFQLLKDGNVLQDGDSADMIFSFDYLIHYISRFITLQTGDLIFTGTPQGVGSIRIGDEFSGLLNGNTLLTCYVK